MAIGRFSMKVGKAGKAGPHAAYIAREGQYASRLDRGEKLEATEAGNMPAWAQSNPLAFWQAADAFERSNGTTYREMEIALPRELDEEQRAALMREFVRQEIGDRHAYQWAIHTPMASDGREQPHVHLMFSERQRDGIDRDPDQYFKRYNGKAPEKGGARKGYGPSAGQTLTKSERIAELKELRGRWEAMCNAHLERAGVEQRIDMRSHAERGTGLEPEQKQLPSQWRGQGKAKVLEFREARAELVAARQELAAVVPDMGAEIINLAEERQRRERMASQKRGLEDLARRVQTGEDIGPIRQALEGAGFTYRTDDPKKWDVPESLHEAWYGLTDALSDRRKARGQAIDELLSGLDLSNPDALKDRVEELRKNAEPVNLAQAQEAGRLSYDANATGNRKDWIQEARRLGGIEKAYAHYRDVHEKASSGVRGWVGSRLKAGRETIQTTADQVKLLETMIAERNAVGIEAGKDLEAQRKQGAEVWSRLEPHIDAAQERFQVLHEENKRKTTQIAIREREERAAKEKAERDQKEAVALSRIVQEGEKYQKKLSEGLGPYMARKAEEAASQEVDRVRTESGLSRRAAAEAFEEGREAERQRADARSRPAPAREERKPEVSKEDRGQEAPDLDRDNGNDFGL